jgi:hypothetical protein
MRALAAYALPMLTFVLLLGIDGLLKNPVAHSWRATPEFWIYPAQTLLCGGLLVYFWKRYQFHSLGHPLFTTAIALLVFVVWISPQQFLRFPPRLDGFNPDLLRAQPAFYWSTLALRFLRLVVVVPLVEEIFWRGLLLRFLIADDFEAVPFGSFSWLSFGVVTLAFCFSHSMPDWPAALITGALYNLVAYRTRSLASCVFAHGLTNLALGLWIVTTKQWGFW